MTSIDTLRDLINVHSMARETYYIRKAQELSFRPPELSPEERRTLTDLAETAWQIAEADLWRYRPLHSKAPAVTH